jgi:hypothetical protein
LLLVIILCCICRFKHIKKQIEKQLKKMKARRNQPVVEPQVVLPPPEEPAPIVPVPLSLSFHEELYAKVTAVRIPKNEEIDKLQHKISILEEHLEKEENLSPSSLRNSQQILKRNEESWKNLYDLHVDFKESN